ncbi:MAG: transposase [Chloroflexi bacterium]|nr:transposase [Chloroflexota bacterium]
MGFKLGVLITPQGIPDVYDLFSARPHDVKTLDDLLDEAQDVLVLGDKGFICDPQRERLAEEQNVLLVTYRKHNQKQQNSPLEQWTLNTFRRLSVIIFK